MRVPLFFTLSGGASNGESDLSLGGAASTIDAGIVASQHFSVVDSDSPIQGIVLLGGQGMTLGTGTLTWSPNSGILDFEDLNGDLIQAAVSSPGVYLLSGDGGFAWVRINSNLPGTVEQLTAEVSPWHQNLFDDVGFSERGSNHTNYRCLYLYNQSGTDLDNVTVSVDSGPTYGTYDLSTEHPGTPTAIVDETDSTNLLSGLSWSSSENLGTVLAGTYASFWVRRFIAASSSGISQIAESPTIKVAFRRE